MQDKAHASENTGRRDTVDAAQFTDVSQVCWIRVGALGDLLVALAALEETLLKFPNAHVWVMGPSLWLQILKPALWPRINGILVVGNNNTVTLYKPEWERWEKASTPQKLSVFFKKCQATVNHRVESYRYALGPFFARVRYRFGTCPPLMKWLYTHWSPWLGKDPIVHERDRHLLLLEAPRTQIFKFEPTQKNRDLLKWNQTGVLKTKPNKYLVVHPKQNPKTLAYKWRDKSLPQILEPNPALLSTLKLENKKYWVVNPTSSRWEKAWAQEKFRDWCAEILPLAQSKGREVIVVGSANETEWLEFVADKKFRVIQPANIEALTNLIACAELVVTNTSSVQFIAATTKTPTLVLMGRTFPARWGPLGKRDHFIAGRVPSDFRGGIFQEDFAGYDSISVLELKDEFQKFLQSL